MIELMGLQRHLTPDSIINSIIGLLKRDKSKVAVIFEGKSDIRFFEKLLVKKNLILKHYDGKEIAINLIKKIRKRKKDKELIKHVISICDADFDHLNNQPDIDSIFLTDTHDCETLVIKAIGVDALIAEYGNDDFKNALTRNLLENSLRLAYEIGLIKWLNSSSAEFTLKFKNEKNEPLNLENFIKFEHFNGNFDKNKYIDTVLNLSLSNKPSKENLLKELQMLQVKELEEKTDKFQVCNGHDIALIMAAILKHYVKNDRNNKKPMIKALSSDDIETTLRISYSKDNFIKTELYEKLSNWQTDNQMPKIVD